MNDILRQAMADGRLEAIFRKWRMWNDDQPGLYARLTSVAAHAGHVEHERGCDEQLGGSAAAYLPALLRAAGITLAAVVPVDGAGRRRRRRDRDRPRLRAAACS